MRTNTPRYAPLSNEEMTSPDQQALLARFGGGAHMINIVRMLMRHPKALSSFNIFAAHIFNGADNTLVPRDKEILILRAAWHTRSGYEWAQHKRIGLREGVTEAEVEWLKLPVAEGGWNERDTVLVQAADALLQDYFIPDELFAKFSRYFNDQQCMDAIFAVGFYAMVAMFLNTTGTPMDGDVELDPDLDFRN